MPTKSCHLHINDKESYVFKIPKMVAILALQCVLLLIINNHKLYVDALEKHELYPYGVSAGDTKLPSVNQARNEDDVSSNEIKLRTNIKFYSSEYGGIYVSLK